VWRFTVPAALVALSTGILFALLRPRPPAVDHILAADVLQQSTPYAVRPSRFVDSTKLQGRWRPVGLPYAPRPKLLIGARGPAIKPLPFEITWFRFAAPPEAVRRPPLYIYIPRWKTDGQIAIYADGRLFYQSHANDQWNGSNMPLWVALEETAESRPPHEILIRMRHVAGIGGSLSTVWIGQYDDLIWTYLIRNAFVVALPTASSIVFLAVGGLTFFVWVRRPREPMYILFTLLSIVGFVRTLQTYVGRDRLPVSDDVFGWATATAALWLLAVVHLFALKIHGRPQRWLTRVALIVAGFWTLVMFPAAPLLDPTLAAPLLYICALILGNTIAVSGLWCSWRARSRAGLGLATVVWFSITLAIYDWFLENNFVNIEGVFLSPYFNIFVTLLIGGIMVNRYAFALASVERANDHLAEQLAARERDLTESHDKLRAAEQRELLIQERRRMMQDMHDGMGSSLVSALRVVERGQLDEAGVIQVLKDCIDDLKLTIDAMEPVESDLLILLATLRFRLQPRLDSTGLKLRWGIQDIPPMAWLDQHNALHILRILQEAITNIIKHAQATEIFVTTEADSDAVYITVADDGRGFDTTKAPVGGKGLANQMRRAKAIGGEASWTSGPSGTRFCLRLPIVNGAG
jgi:signal transduction histidine kinase